MHKRRGLSLLEILVAISVSSVMLTLATLLLHTLLRAERIGARHLLQGVTRSRVAEAFCRDLHDAVAATRIDAGADSPNVFELTFGDERHVAYQFANEYLRRVETKNGQITRREEFPLPSAAVEFELQEGSPRLASLMIQERARPPTQGGSPDAPTAPPRRFRIDAALARNHRYEAQPSTKSD